jgi:RNA polymerase sigma-70 factor, ECF subfamily
MVGRTPQEHGGPQLAVIAGERVEFRALFVEHYRFVWRLLAHFGVLEAARDDAAQEVFAVVHRRLADYDGRTPMRAWLVGIARRVASTLQRTQARAARRLEVVAAPAQPTLPDVELEQRQQIALAQSCLAGLDADQRDVLVLTEIEGLTAPEIALALGIKLNTVYSRLRVARENFQRAVTRAQARAERSHHAGT